RIVDRYASVTVSQRQLDGTKNAVRQRTSASVWPGGERLARSAAGGLPDAAGAAGTAQSAHPAVTAGTTVAAVAKAADVGDVDAGASSGAAVARGHTCTAVAAGPADAPVAHEA